MLHTTTLLYMFRRIKTVYLTPISICLNVLSFSIWLLHRQCLGLFPLNNVSTGRRQEMLRCGRITKWHSCRLFTSNVIWQPQFRTSCSKLDLQTPSLALVKGNSWRPTRPCMCVCVYIYTHIYVCICIHTQLTNRLSTAFIPFAGSLPLSNDVLLARLWFVCDAKVPSG